MWLTENSQWRLRKEKWETKQVLLAGRKEYLARHNRTLMVMDVAWEREQNLLDQSVKWHQEKRNKGHVLENSLVKLVHFTKNDNIEKAGFDPRRKANKNHLNMRYGIPTSEQYRNKETGKEN